MRKGYRKKKLRQSSHGIWKIAYADFVTAMMAFFLLLWVLYATPEEVLKGIAEYFTPTGKKTEGMGTYGGTSPNIRKGHYTSSMPSSSLVVGSPIKGELEEPLSNQDLREKRYFINIMNNSNLKKYEQHVEIVMKEFGLVIKVMDTNGSPMFKPNSNQMNPLMREILSIIGNMIKDLSNHIVIIGHTTKVRKDQDNNIDTWSLSALRANETRKFLNSQFIKPDQVIRIVGVSDTEPENIHDPFDSKNIKIDIILLNKNATSRYHRSIPKNAFTKG